MTTTYEQKIFDLVDSIGMQHYYFYHSKTNNNMKKFIIRFGGLIPGYLSNFDNLTCHPSEAKTFDTVESAKLAFWHYDYSGQKGVSIREFESGVFVEMLN